MYHWMDGWGWFWMSSMMVFWIVVLGFVVYVAVKLANRPRRVRKFGRGRFAGESWPSREA